MGYLNGTGQVEPYEEVERCVAASILSAWQNGISHPLRLGNVGIRVIEKGDWRDDSKVLLFAKKDPH